ncbi:hypothetical protein GF377_05455, partial [candidate division GN15 bacterium]|nr:hypothetical protein [candidate division GN15 bacterium]
MNPQVMNIVDQLLGVAEPGKAVIPSLGGKVSPDGALFADILSRLGVNPETFQLGKQLDPTAINTPQVNADQADDFVQALTDAAEGNEAVKQLQALFPQLTQAAQAGADADRKQPVDILNQQPTNRDADQQSRNTQTAQPVNPLVEDFARRVVSNPQWQKMLATQPADLEPALYKVLDAKLVDQKVEMTVVGNNDTAEPVKLSLPANVLAPLADGRNSRRVAVDLTGRKTGANTSFTGDALDSASTYNNANKQQLQRLFQNLNLKSLEITQEQTDVRPDRPSNDVAMRLTVEHLGRRKTLELTLPRQDVRTVHHPKIHGTADQQMVQSARTGENALGIESPSHESRPTTRPVAVPSQTTKVNTAPRPFD